MAKENELLSLGGQAAAAAHSLGTPLSTILLTAKELQKDVNRDDDLLPEIFDNYDLYEYDIIKLNG